MLGRKGCRFTTITMESASENDAHGVARAATSSEAASADDVSGSMYRSQRHSGSGDGAERGGRRGAGGASRRYVHDAQRALQL